MRVLVTGAAGSLGAAMGEALLRRGDDVALADGVTRRLVWRRGLNQALY